VAAGELDTGHERRLGADEVAQLVGDRAEHLGRPRAAGYQRGHTPQRGLLVGELTQPCLVGWIVARPRTGGTAHVGAGVWRFREADGSPTLGRPTRPGTVARGLRLIQ